MEALFQTPEWDSVLYALLGDGKYELESLVEDDSFGKVEQTVRQLVDFKCRDGKAISRESGDYVEIGDGELREIVLYLSGAFQDSLTDEAVDTESQAALNLTSYTLYTAAFLLEAMRTPLRWQDLTDRERGILEPAMLDYLHRRQTAWDPIPSGVLPLDDGPVQFAFRLIILWSRTDGKLPAWAEDFFETDDRSRDN